MRSHKAPFPLVHLRQRRKNELGALRILYKVSARICNQLIPLARSELRVALLNFSECRIGWTAFLFLFAGR
jgi:hypothetical protein